MIANGKLHPNVPLKRVKAEHDPHEVARRARLALWMPGSWPDLFLTPRPVSSSLGWLHREVDDKLRK